MQVRVQGLPAQYRQFGFFLPFFLLVSLVLFRRLGLSLKMLQLTPQFFPQVRQALQVLLGTAYAAFSFLAPFLVLGNPCCLFDVHPQLFRLGFNKPGNHALLNNRVTTRAQAGPQKQISDVAAPAL